MDRRLSQAFDWLKGVLRDPVQESDMLGECRPPATEVDAETLEQGLRQVELLRQGGRDLAGTTLLDVGTCWQPTIPLVFFLAGCDDLVLVDRKRVLTADCLRALAAGLRSRAPAIAARLGLPERRVQELLRPDPGATFFGVLRHFKMQYLAPCDLLETKLPAASIDIVTGRSLLERYTERYVRLLLGEAGRLLKPDGVVGLSLEQTERLRYRKLLKDARFTLEDEESTTVLRVISDEEPPDETAVPRSSFLIAAPPRHEADEASS